MAQEGFDALLALTDSRYRLSMIVARRAAQLKGGIPNLLEPEEMPNSGRQNTVTLAMKELQLDKELHWGDDLPSLEELRRVHELERRSREVEFVAAGGPA
jgi:DNA-directed RNA polymerase subunit omega